MLKLQPSPLMHKQMLQSSQKAFWQPEPSSFSLKCPDSVYVKPNFIAQVCSRSRLRRQCWTEGWKGSHGEGETEISLDILC